MHAAFAADAGKSGAAKGSSQVAQKPAIHPCDADIHLLCDAMAALKITGPDRGCEAVLRIIGHSNRFLFGIKGRDVANRPKDFFFHTACRFGESSIDGWLHVEAVVAVVVELWSCATCHKRRSFFLRQF